MCYLPIGCVQVQLLRPLMLKVREGDIRLQLQSFCNLFQSLGAENGRKGGPKEVLTLGMISEIYLLERVLRVGVGDQ